jgi:hypothetical protein
MLLCGAGLHPAADLQSALSFDTGLTSTFRFTGMATKVQKCTAD